MAIAVFPRSWFVRLGVVLALLAAPARTAAAQDPTTVTGNLWLDFIVNWGFSSDFRFWADNYYRTLISGAPTQRMVGTRPELAYGALGWLQVMGGANIRYTDDSDGLNSWELRPYVGVQFTGDRFRRVTFQNYTRLEYRNFLYTDSDSTAASWRLRTRFEIAGLVSGRTFSDPGSWHVSGDVEFFVDLSDPVDERFADRARIRLGVGHVRTRKWQFDAFYVVQFSRDTQTSGVTSIDNFLRLRVKFYPNTRFLYWLR
jgi:hypothetical protein